MFELFLAQSRLNSNNAQAEKSRENAARSAVLKQQANSQNLIIIVKQSIDKTAISRIDKRMQMTLKLWTYLEWPNNKSSKSNSDCKNGFWQKLATCVHNSLNHHYQSIV